MIEIIIWILILIISLFALVKGSDYFLKYAIKISLIFRIPLFLVGILVVSFATTLPELITSIVAATKGSSEIVVGNVIGSNIANILLIVGLTAFFVAKYSLKAKYDMTKYDLPVMILSSLFLLFTSLDGQFTWVEGIIGIVGFILYLVLTKIRNFEKERGELHKFNSNPLDFLGLLISLGVVLVGANLTVESIINLSIFFNIGTELIAMTAVAIGTSLPELFIGIQAVKKGVRELVLGEVVGANIYNSLIVMGIPSLINGVIIVPKGILYYSLPIMVLATLMYAFMSLDKKITRYEGGVLFVFYLLFIWGLIF